MARTFDQILSDVTAQSDPQRKAILSQIADLPNQQAADEASLNAQKDQAYQDILSGARERGVGFSGIPMGEQAKYNATSFAPALAKLKSGYVTQRGNLDSALAGIGSNDYATANNIFNQQQTLAEQQREFDANLALQREAAAAQNASNAALSSLFAGGGGGNIPAASMTQRSNGGFNFTDANGTPISAAQYSQIKGVPFRTLLQQMAAAGDQGAKTALAYVGNDYGYNAPKVGSNKQVINLLNALLWGVNSVKGPITLSGSLGPGSARLQG